MLGSDRRRALESSVRRRRHRLLTEQLESIGNSLEILDVGGTLDYWRLVGLPSVVKRVVLLNTFMQSATAPYEGAVGDARDLSRYGDHHFDVVFSNSVIGHVGSFEDQMQMATEVQRVGRHFFVQTPNHGFPIDWRTLVPFFHFLPPATQARCFERFQVGSYRRAVDAAEAQLWATRVRNIRRRELKQLFPKCSVIDERVLGLTKSFMIHNFPAR